MSIPGIQQKAQQQQIIITSGQNQQPAVNGSVFNEQEATAASGFRSELSLPLGN